MTRCAANNASRKRRHALFSMSYHPQTITTMDKKADQIQLNPIIRGSGLLLAGFILLRYIFGVPVKNLGLWDWFGVFAGITVFLILRNPTQIRKLLVSAQFRRFLSGVLLSLFSVIFSLAALEGFARIWVRRQTPEAESNSITITPFNNDPVLMAMQEEADFVRSRHTRYIEEKGLFLLPDFESEYLNIVDNLRVTTDQPESFRHTIYLFGGSTMTSLEVPDSRTIPSILQHMINAQYPDTYRLQNYGVNGYTAPSQTDYLEKVVDLQPGDIVIFYDGVNDTPYPYFCCIDFETHHLLDISDTFSFGKLFFMGLKFLENHSVFYNKFIDTKDVLPPYLWSPSNREEILSNLTNRYQTSLIKAADLSTSANAHFFHFLQPSIYTSQSFSAYEETIVLDRYPGAFKLATILGYEEVQAAMGELEEMGIHNKDLTDILDVSRRPPGVEYYFDWCHVNHLANEVIAQHIFEEIKPQLEAQYQP